MTTLSSGVWRLLRGPCSQVGWTRCLSFKGSFPTFSSRFLHNWYLQSIHLTATCRALTIQPILAEHGDVAGDLDRRRGRVWVQDLFQPLHIRCVPCMVTISFISLHICNFHKSFVKVWPGSNRSVARLQDGQWDHVALVTCHRRHHYIHRHCHY